VLVDVTVAIADGAVTDIPALVDREAMHGSAGDVASTPMICRVLVAIGNAVQSSNGPRR